MKAVAIVAGLLGLALLTVLLVHSDVPAILSAGETAGPALFWIVPYRLIFFALYAIGWRALLQPFDPERRASFGYVLWVTIVREAVDRLLPVASVGGGVLGIRLMTWRGLAPIPVSATVIVEALLTFLIVCLFGCLATAIYLTYGSAPFSRQLLYILMVGLAMPICALLLVRFGSVFQRVHVLISPLVGLSGRDEAAVLDAQLRLSIDRVQGLLMAGTLQGVALISATFEIWWALRLFGHPVSVPGAIMLEGLSQTARHLVFIVPAGLGVQEAALVMFGHALGLSSEIALAVSAVKRGREILCGLPPILVWQWQETRRLRPAGREF